jgi:hypothetical protein
MANLTTDVDATDLLARLKSSADQHVQALRDEAVRLADLLAAAHASLEALRGQTTSDVVSSADVVLSTTFKPPFPMQRGEANLQIQGFYFPVGTIGAGLSTRGTYRVLLLLTKIAEEPAAGDVGSVPSSVVAG